MGWRQRNTEHGCVLWNVVGLSIFSIQNKITIENQTWMVHKRWKTRTALDEMPRRWYTKVS